MSHHLPKDLLKRLGSEIAKEREEKELQEKLSLGVSEALINIARRLETLETTLSKLMATIRFPAQYPEKKTVRPPTRYEGVIEKIHQANTGKGTVKPPVPTKPNVEIDI